MTGERWQWAVIAVLAGMTVALGTLIFFWFVIDARPPVTEVYSHPVPVAGPSTTRAGLADKSQARAGEEIYIYRESCWTRTMIGQIKRSLFMHDKAVFIFPAIPIGNLALACQGITGVLPLPKTLPPGSYRLVASIEFEPNPFTQIVVPFNDVSFEVVQ